jgi:hypothetical protein
MDMMKHFGVEKSFTDAIYFTTATHATVGFGDITPKTNLARWIVSIHTLCVLFSVMVLVSA